MAVSIEALSRMKAGTRELFVLSPGETYPVFKRKLLPFKRAGASFNFTTALIVHKDKTTEDAIWVEVLAPVSSKKTDTLINDARTSRSAV